VSAPSAEPVAPRHRAADPDDATDDRDVASFLVRFRRFGAEPAVATYMPLFHPDVALFDDGMERPIGYDEIPASITATLDLAQAFRMVPERWRHRGGVIFVEARNEATILGTPCRWQSVYRVRVARDRVIDGRRYYDRAPLLAAFDPAAPRLVSVATPRGDDHDDDGLRPRPCLDRGVTAAELVELCDRAWRDGCWNEIAATFRDDATWHVPGSDPAIARDGLAGSRRRFARLLGGATPRLRAWAGDDTLLMMEWCADVPARSGDPYVLGMVDRIDLAAGRVLAARTYFDAASLARALA
jgi:ketosteroid isomerase-like protein